MSASSTRTAAPEAASGAETSAPAVGYALPALFVLLWASGFAACKATVAHGGGISVLALRFSMAAAVLLLYSLAVRAAWPRGGRQWGHLLVSGTLIHATYLGPNFWAAARGFPVGLTALIGAMQPLLTAILASRFMGETVTRRQWIGLGLGLVGIVMVLDDRIAFNWSRPVELAAVCIGLVSLTVGTLYQKRYCGFQDLRSGPAIQLAVGAAVVSLGLLVVEPYRVEWTTQFTLGLAWLVILSATIYGIMAFLFRRGAASRVASLFYLVPPITSLALWLFFEERLGPLAIAGMVVTVAGVALATRK